jgi:hypothetical protein
VHSDGVTKNFNENNMLNEKKRDAKLPVERREGAEKER